MANQRDDRFKRIYSLIPFRNELLGVRSTRKLASVSTRLERRIKQIERMPAKPKQQQLGIIDTFIATHQ